MKYDRRITVALVVFALVLLVGTCSWYMILSSG